MLYIKIGDNKYPIKSFNVFTTQNGQTGVRITGDTPQADGFEIYDEDVLVADGKDYTYLYREDGNVKEYTKEAEEIIPTESFYIGDYPDNPMQKQINALNRRVSEITPYTVSKEAGIQDKECVFDGMYKDGIISATVITSRGEQIPCTTEKSGDSIIVKFNELEDTATVTISIQ